MSSKPAIEILSGTATPAAVKPRIKPIAIASSQANTASVSCGNAK